MRSKLRTRIVLYAHRRPYLLTSDAVQLIDIDEHIAHDGFGGEPN